MLRLYASDRILCHAEWLCVADEHGEIVAEFEGPDALNAFLFTHHLTIALGTRLWGSFVFDLVPAGVAAFNPGEDVPA